MSNQLATKVETGGKKAEGFCTPKEDTKPQKMSIPPKRVLPIVFLPGIMGSNLRMSAERQELLGKSNNIAWCPDRKTEALKMVRASPAHRQAQLDEEATEVDTYSTDAPTGSGETARERQDNGRVRVNLCVGLNTPLLLDDPIVFGQHGGKSKEEKAQERGWGEIYFTSYRAVLETCEQRLNETFVHGRMHPWWRRIVGVAPREWQACPNLNMAPITEQDLKSAVEGCWFPVHAMGYNWLASNEDSGIKTAARIGALIEQYNKQGYQCERVIVVTHSMGGLVARALIHPRMGNISDKVLGIVHGVMPALGAAATYKRMRCGFEESIFALDPAPKVLGNRGAEVTAVLGNSAGGLQLLPSEAYGNGWLRVVQNGSVILNLPCSGDPYEEIYKLRNKWYRLVRQDWLNPADYPTSTFKRTCKLLDKAKKFHRDIKGMYQAGSYAHYGADASRPSWQHVEWMLDSACSLEECERGQISTDNQQGQFSVRMSHRPVPVDFKVELAPPAGAGDQTVPLHSAEDQLHSGRFKGIFRQTGYEHQGSYQDDDALASTLFSLVRIAQTMTWSAK